MKIVSLLPAATEILCDMGLAEYISAVSHECDYPSTIDNKLKITSSILPHNIDQNAIDKLVKEAVKNNIPLYAVDNEQLNTINPDLIITQGLCDVCSISEDKMKEMIKDLDKNIKINETFILKIPRYLEFILTELEVIETYKKIFSKNGSNN